jgi:FkbM family methyltransferase
MYPKVLVYCGIHRCAVFDHLVRRFDVAYGFEAIPELAEEARKRYETMRNVYITHAAVTQEPGPVSFYIHDPVGASSIGRLSDGYRNFTNNQFYAQREVTVPGINLYHFLRERSIELIDLYVSDIQGMDFVVLKTLQPYLHEKRIKKLLCETERDSHDFESYDGLPSNRQSLFESLLERDYKVVRGRKVVALAHQDTTWRLKVRHLVDWYRRRLKLKDSE